MKPYTVMTVCTGNICRSPMAQIALEKYFRQAGIGPDDVFVDSTGVSDEEHGHPIDPRARRILRERGYEIPRHHARQISQVEAATTDLLLPMTIDHMRELMWYVPQNRLSHVRLYRSFDPALPPLANQYDTSQDLVDPWPGGRADFVLAMDQIEHVAPYIVQWVAQQIGVTARHNPQTK
jgi:protein-tyrosine phosphatase